MDWKEIKSIATSAMEHGKDICITIEANGYKQIDITTPKEQIIETTTRSRYVLEQREEI